MGSSASCSEVLSRRSKGCLSQRWFLGLHLGIICHLSEVKQKLLTNTILQSLLNHWSEKKMAFKLSKSQIQLKIKQSISLELRSVHYWVWTWQRKKLPKESKLRYGKQGRKKIRISAINTLLEETSFFLLSFIWVTISRKNA